MGVGQGWNLPTMGVQFCIRRIYATENANKALIDNHCPIAYINHLLLKKLRSTFSHTQIPEVEKYHTNNHIHRKLLFLICQK